MHRVFLFVLLVGAALIMVGMLLLGAFPPKPHPETVQHTIPTAKIQTHP